MYIFFFFFLLKKKKFGYYGICEILYIRRSLSPTDRWSGDLAFPGGKSNPGESDRETCERETMEEVGLDLKSEK